MRSYGKGGKVSVGKGRGPKTIASKSGRKMGGGKISTLFQTRVMTGKGR